VIDTFIAENGGLSCSGELGAAIKPGGIMEITSFAGYTCKAVKGCERLEGSPEPRNMPWQLELYKEGSETRGNLKATNGNAPGFNFDCRWKLKGNAEWDTCGLNTSTKMTSSARSSSSQTRTLMSVCRRGRVVGWGSLTKAARSG
jgi:hypothetical protein